MTADEIWQRVVPLEAVWWLGFFSMLGLCIGSFLNVVIFRIPNNIALRDPLWSFCPLCKERIRWYDNIPLLSYILLRGRCRFCSAPISPRYPLVEVLGGLVVLLLFDAFCIADTHSGMSDVPGITWQLGRDWPILLAHIVLFASLLAMSAIDLEHYWVDIRFTSLATAFGFIMHAFWTPERNNSWPRPDADTAVGAIAAMILVLLTIGAIRLLFPDTEEIAGHGHEGPTEEAAAERPPTGIAPTASSADGASPLTNTDEPAAESTDSAAPSLVAAGGELESVREPTPVAEPSALSALSDSGATADDAATGAEGAESLEVYGPPLPPSMTQPAAVQPHNPWALVASFAAATIGAFALLALIALGWRDAAFPDVDTEAWMRWAAPLGLFFVLITTSLATHRESDQEIVETIEAERHTARGQALLDLLLLAPAIIAAVGAIWWIHSSPTAAARWNDLLNLSFGDDIRPVLGLSTAATGFLIGGALGWGVRIVTMLAWGKETLGTGDIHMLAAAGCVAGWPVAVLGFVAANFLALFAFVLCLPFKRSAALAFGPWLSLGFLIVVVFYDQVIGSRLVQNVVDLYQNWGTLFHPTTGGF